MKEKNVAGILALFLGIFGVHRFYLGQTGLGIFYLIFCWAFPLIWILGLIDAIVFFSMDKEAFDLKYNRDYYQLNRRKPDTDFDRHQKYREERERRRRDREYRHREREEQRPQSHPKQFQHRRPRPQAQPKANPYKSSGIRKYKEYDYDGAIEDFKKALDINAKDVAVHFNIACAYSLNENVEKALYHLDKAVGLGFNDFKRIKDHDALAFVRIQDQFEEFERNGFRLLPQLEAPKEDLLSTLSQPEPQASEIETGSVDLLEQLRKLGELREKGLLTEEEFTAQKKRLLD